MTRTQFVEMAIREMEREIGVPAKSGWWGTYRDVTNGIHRVRLVRDAWVLSYYNNVISRHASKKFAISKARKLEK